VFDLLLAIQVPADKTDYIYTKTRNFGRDFQNLTPKPIKATQQIYY